MRGSVVPLLIVLLGVTFDGRAQPGQVSNRDLTNVSITLRRDPCLGECPVYSVTLRGDGSVIYKGRKFVAVRGERRYKISREQVAELVETFYNIDYFALSDEYRSIVAPDGSVTVGLDQPGVETSIKIGGKAKSVYNYFGGPAVLKELERKIDEISGALKLVHRS